MSALTPVVAWDDVTQIETTTAVLGGPGGPANTPHQELVNRTEFLRNRIGDMTGLATAAPPAVGTSSQKGSSTKAALEDHVHGITTATLNALGVALGQSLASSGYQKLAGGLIIQWGLSGAIGGGVTVAFPVAFPNACLSVALALRGSTYLSFAPAISSLSAAGMTIIQNVYNGNQAACPASWIALGY